MAQGLKHFLNLLIVGRLALPHPALATITVENLDCLPNTRSCSTPNGSGTQDWNGSSYTNCVANTCDSTFHIESGSCVANIQSCTDSLISAGTKTWNSGTSSYNDCIPSACISDYHITNNQCVSNFESCSVTNGSGIATWTGTEFGSCIATSCTGSNHVENGVCVANIQSCLVNEGSGEQAWNSTTLSYDACVVSECNTYYQIAANGLSCELNATALNTEFSKLRRFSPVSNLSYSSNFIISAGTQTTSTLFSLSGLNTSKKYRLKSPTYIRMQTTAASTTSLIVDGRTIMYSYPAGQGAVSTNIDYTFTPTTSSPLIQVNSKSGNGIVADFLFSETADTIKLDLYEVIDAPPVVLTQGNIAESTLNSNFQNTEIKDTLVQTIPEGGSAALTSSVSIVSLGTLTDLVVGEKYHISSKYLNYQNSTCGTNPIGAVKLNGQVISVYQTPTDGYYSNALEVDFIATATSLPLTFERGSGTCSAGARVYFDDINIYKKKTLADLNTFSPGNSITSAKLIENFSKLNKKDIFVQSYTRSSNLIPTSGTTYAQATLFNLTGLIVGKKYKLKTPTYLNIRSGSSSSNSALWLAGSMIKQSYSNAGASNLYLHFDYEFTATSTSMILQNSSRNNNGLHTDFNGQIALDLYESGN